MISALYFGSMSLDQSPSRSYCVVFLGNTIHSHIATLNPRVQMSTGDFNASANPTMD